MSTPPPASTPAPTVMAPPPGDTTFMNHTLPIGTMVGGLQITGLIGEGGFGIVYLAFDTTLQRQVALKEYMPSSLASRNPGSADISVKSPRFLDTFNAGLRSFVNEARLLAHFDHPSLVKVHQFWQANRTAYMVMPYYQGPTLKAHVATLAAAGRRPDEGMLRQWLNPLLDALATMHAENCFHRDIAPDNILLTSNGPLLLDFGAARRVISDMTQALTVILKPGYAPIEQYGDVATMTQGAWTDLYALASVVYYCITGHSPITSVERVMGDPLPRLQRVAAGQYSNTFLAAIDAALAVRPGDRPQSVAEFRDLLEGRAEPRQISAAAAPAPAPAGEPPAVPAAYALDQTMLRTSPSRGAPGGPGYAPTVPMTAPPGGAQSAVGYAPTAPSAPPAAAEERRPRAGAPAAAVASSAPAASPRPATTPAAMAHEAASPAPGGRRGLLLAGAAAVAAVAVGGVFMARRGETPVGSGAEPGGAARLPVPASPAARTAVPAVPSGGGLSAPPPGVTPSGEPSPAAPANTPPAAPAPATPAATARTEPRPAPRPPPPAPRPRPAPAPAPMQAPAQARPAPPGGAGTTAFPVPGGTPGTPASPTPPTATAPPATVPTPPTTAPTPPTAAAPQPAQNRPADAPTRGGAAPSGIAARCAELLKKGNQGTLTLEEAAFLRKECR